MLNRSKLAAVGLLVAVFASGIAVGGAASAAWGDRPKIEENRREGRRDHDYADHLREELGLSVSQRDSVQRILETYQQAMSDLWAEVRPRMQQIRAEVRGDVAGVLDEEQQARFVEHNARSDSARAARSNAHRRRGDRR